MVRFMFLGAGATLLALCSTACAWGGKKEVSAYRLDSLVSRAKPAYQALLAESEEHYFRGLAGLGLINREYPLKS